MITWGIVRAPVHIVLYLAGCEVIGLESVLQSGSVLRLHPIAVFVATNRRSALAMLFTKIFTILQTPQFDHSCTFVFYYIQTPSLDAICILIIDCLKQLPLLMTQIVKICFINKDFGGDCKMSFIIIRWCKNSSNN